MDAKVRTAIEVAWWRGGNRPVGLTGQRCPVEDGGAAAGAIGGLEVTHRLAILSNVVVCLAEGEMKRLAVQRRQVGLPEVGADPLNQGPVRDREFRVRSKCLPRV